MKETKLTNEHFRLLKKAYDCLDKVTSDISIDANDENGERIWKAYMALVVFDFDIK